MFLVRNAEEKTQKKVQKLSSCILLLFGCNKNDKEV